MQSIQYELFDGILDCLMTQDELRVVERDDKSGRRIEKEADVMTKIVEIEATRWKSVMDFAINKKLVSPDELVALRIACQLPSKIPNPIQSRRLLVLLDRVYEEGFKL